MKRLSIAGAVALLFALGCGVGEVDEREVQVPADEDVTPDDRVDPGEDATAEEATCCCAYTEEGSSEVQHSEMVASSCEAWGHECVDASECAEPEEGEAEEAAAEPEAPAPTTTRSTSSGTRATSGSMSRPGSGKRGGERIPGRPIREQSGSSSGSRTGGSLSRPR